MNAHGWSGAFAGDAEAHGDGPSTFADFLTQELQWARSLTEVMLRHTRRYWRGLGLREKMKLGFCEIWYGLYAVHLLMAALFPVLALSLSEPWVDVELLDFFAHVAPVSVVALITSAWVRARGWLRPRGVPLVSWESVLFLFTRWPWVLWGVVQAWVGWLVGRRLSFVVTPKGEGGPRSLPLRAVAPYLLISIACALTTLIVDDPGAARGYYLFALVNAGVYLAVAVAVIALHLVETRPLGRAPVLDLAGRPIAAAALTGCLVAIAIATRSAAGAQALIPTPTEEPISRAVRSAYEHLLAGVSVRWLVVAALVVMAGGLASTLQARRLGAGPAWFRHASPAAIAAGGSTFVFSALAGDGELAPIGAILAVLGVVMTALIALAAYVRASLSPTASTSLALTAAAMLVLGAALA